MRLKHLPNLRRETTLNNSTGKRLVEWNFNKNSFIAYCAALCHKLNGSKPCVAG